MKTLDKKLLRDLKLMWSQALTIALVVASGVAGFITSFSAYDALSWSRDLYYVDARFADVFATLKRAPLSLEPQLQAMTGAAHVETSQAQVVPVSIANVADPIVGLLLGLDPVVPPRLNKLNLRSGRMLSSARSGSSIGPMEALVSEGFAQARGLKPGDSVTALINGTREQLLIVGIALSPEYIFAGLGGSPDQRGFGVFWVDKKTLAAAYNMEGAFNQVAVRLGPGASEGAVIDQLDRLLARYGASNAHGRDLQMSNAMLNSEISQQRVMGTVLPSIFLAVAAFLLNVVLGRQIATQREQVAALKALGYDNLAIGLHYLKLLLLIVALGLVLGLALGAVLGQLFVGVYAESFRFPDMRFRLRPDLVLVAVFVTLGAAVLATVSAIRATVQLAPAEAMRAPSPGIYKPMLIERWGLQKNLSPALRMVLRTMARRPLRSSLTVFGVALSMAIVITGAFMRDSVAVLMDTQFSQALRGDVVVALLEATPASVLYAAAKLPHVTAVEGMRSVPVRLVNGHHSWRGTLSGKAAQPELNRIVDMNRHAYSAPRDGLLLTDRLAVKLGLKIGDLVRVEMQEGRRAVLELPVSGTVHEMLGLNAYLERASLNKLLREGALVNSFTVAIERGFEPALLSRLKDLPRVAMVISKATMAKNIEDVTVGNLLMVSSVLTAFAIVIAVGVVYNNARIALAERGWELASLRVLGFTRGEVSAILLGELAIEIALALPLGMLLGYLLASGIVTAIQTDEFYFPFVITPATYAFSALCVLLAGAVSAFIVRRRVDALDLVAVLKTRE
ncbi:ABC transporter permease [Roseateles sp.]|uniref:ABC transporter permease n=1 Tax=Roseateles sp. TaxID=1971397 RepID=UPI00286D2AAB|nr:ABC transporter permease [Roseateles sp.]